MKLQKLCWLGLALGVAVLNAADSWTGEMKKFEKEDIELPTAPGGVVFVGSSSIRFWDLARSFPEYPVLNRGFGGSEMHDSLRHLDLLVLKHKPAVIFLYAGDNDVFAGRKAEEIFKDYQQIARRIRAELPTAELVYIPIKSSPARVKLRGEMEKTNELIEEFNRKDKHLHSLPVDRAFLTDKDEIDPQFFRDDGLHLSAAGYEAWNKVVRAWLDEHGVKKRAPEVAVPAGM